MRCGVWSRDWRILAGMALQGKPTELAGKPHYSDIGLKAHKHCRLRACQCPISRVDATGVPFGISISVSFRRRNGPSGEFSGTKPKCRKVETLN